VLHKVQRQDENQLRESLSPGHWPIKDRHSCSRFWGRDRLSTSVVRGASPFWKSSFVRAKKRQTRDRALAGHATLATPCLFLPFFSQKYNPHLFTQPLLTAEPMHPPAHSQTAFVGWCRAAVPTLSGANIDSGAVPVPVFAPGSGNSTTRRRRVV